MYIFFLLVLETFPRISTRRNYHRARHSLLNYNHRSHGEIVIFHKGNSVA